MAKSVLVDLLAYTGKKGGTDVYIKNLYKNISSLDFKFKFFGFASKESKDLDMSWFPGEVSYSRLSCEKRIEWSIGEVFALPFFTKKTKPDLIHCPANFGPLKTTIPTLLTVHDSLYWSSSRFAPNLLLLPGVKILQKYAIKNASKIITSSEASAKEISSIHEVNLSDISVINLAAEEKNLDVISDSSHSNYLLAGGNRFKHKNWDGLLKGLQLIDPEVRPKMIITGGRSPDPLSKIVDSLGLKRDVQLLEWVPNHKMQELYANAKAIIVPSYTESYLPLLQAMKFGKPLLASAIAPHIEMAGTAAYYFDPYLARSIADAILLFLNDPKGASTKAQIGLERSNLFSWSKCALQTLKLMESM